MTIGFTPHMQQILHWAEKQMVQEQVINELAKKSPTIKNAVEQVQIAREQLTMLITLTTEGNNDECADSQASM